MPPKPKVKTTVCSVANARFTNIPRINSTCAYLGWLNTLLSHSHNKKSFLVSEKKELDQLFRRQAEQQFSHDYNKLKRALAKVDESASKAAWTQWKAQLQAFSPSAREASEFDSDFTSLSLPRVGEDRRERNGTKEQWEFQTYEEFARQAEQKNLDVAFHKETMDAAFLWSALRPRSAALSTGRLLQWHMQDMRSMCYATYKWPSATRAKRQHQDLR